MATSGSFDTNKVGNFYFTVYWERTGYSSANNTHDIYYKATAHNTPGKWRHIYDCEFIINDSETVYSRYSSSSLTFRDGDVICDGTVTIPSDNDAGALSLPISFSVGVDSYHGYNCTGSDRWTVDPVPRYPTGCSISLKSRTLNSITINWSCNQNCNCVQYRLNDGSWVDMAYSGKSGSYTITGLQPGTSYKIEGDFKRSDSGLWSSHNNDIPQINPTTYQKGLIYGVNFNDEENPTITYENAFGNSVSSLQVCISWTGAADIPYRTISNPGTSGSYTFNLTNAERTALRNATPNSNTMPVTFYIKTTYGNSSWTDTNARTLTIVNADPTFTNYTFQDEGSGSVRLTAGSGATSSNIFIDDYNLLKAHITTANKAIANKGASMVKYKIECGNLSQEVNYSSNSEVILSLDYIRDKTIKVTAYDTRGNYKTITKTIADNNWKAYIKPVLLSLVVARNNGVDTKTRLTFSGTFWGYSFGSVNNTITECKYRYKKTTESSYGAYKSITPTISGNNVSFNDLIIGDAGSTSNEGFVLTNAYDIEFYITDKISRYSITRTLLLNKGTPAMAIAPGGVSFGTPYNTTNGGAFQIQGNKVDILGDNLRINDSNRVNASGISFGAAYNTTNGGAFQIQGNKVDIASSILRVNGTPIVERDSNSNGEYIKWADGTMIAYVVKSYNINVTSEWGYMYESPSISLGNWPASFSTVPKVFAQNVGGTSIFTEAIQGITTTSIGATWFCRPVYQANTSTTMAILGIGRWK